jgi:hypothetical protein
MAASFRENTVWPFRTVFGSAPFLLLCDGDLGFGLGLGKFFQCAERANMN